jgi:hypothetical protein
MQTFDFFLDQKVTTWMRTPYSVEAETVEEAKKIAIEKYESGDLEEISWDEIDGVKETLEPEDNGGESTVEIFLDGEKKVEIFNNEQTEK